MKQPLQDRYRAVFEGTSEAVLVINDEGFVVDSNPAARAMYGYTSKELIGRHASQLMGADEFSSFGREIKEGKQLCREEDHRNKEGVRIEVQLSGFPVTVDGRPGMLAIVSRRPRGAIDSDREIEEPLHSVSHRTAVGLAQADLEPRIPGDDGRGYVNPPWIAFTGMSADALEQWVRRQRVHPDDLDKTVQAWQVAIETGDPLSLEHRLQSTGGEYHWHTTRARPVRNSENKLTMWLGSTTDIHHIKVAEEAAIRRSDQIRQLAEIAMRLNTAHDLSAVMEVVTTETRKLIGAHQAVTSFTGSGELTHAMHTRSLSDKYALWRGTEVPCGSLCVEVCRSNQPMKLTQAELEADDRWQRDLEERRKQLPMRGWLAAPLTGRNGRNGRNIGLIHLSEKYEGEFSAEDEAILVQVALMASVALENARLVEDLRVASRRKDEFLATLAHELRNPLAPLRNMLQIMSQGRHDQQVVARACDSMERQVVHMVRLIDDLLDVSRISRGKLELRREHVELGPIIEDAMEICRAQLEDGTHEFLVNLPPDSVRLHADPVRLIQIFDNLLDNACKYTEVGGKIWLTAELQGCDLLVTVRDTGIGIPPDKLDSIFQMFTQVDQSSDRIRGGLGLGLTLVKQLVEMHGGTITAHSDGAGQGAEFRVRLPMVAETANPNTPSLTKPDEPHTANRRILIVDDNRDNADSLAKLLEFTGNKTLTAYDGLEGIRAAEEFRPDTLLLDIGLPKVNGLEVCRHVREQPWGKSVLVVAVSGWGQEEDRRKSREVGFDHHLVKPVNPSELVKLLRSNPST